ncbi:28S ribosomal protein S27, mitochondrial, partial [Trichinella pseudospiralis]
LLIQLLNSISITFSELQLLMLQHFWRQNFQCSKRFLLSAAYDCSEEWRKRLEAPIFKNTDADEFITDLRKRFLGKKVASPIDLDVAVNLVQRKDHLDELKSCIYKIRHTKLSASVLPSTHHALVRSFLHLGCEDMFMEMIDDPINYGLFPDAFSANIAMNYFIIQDKFSFAAKIACHMMKQEEFRLSTCWLSVYSCLKWLLCGDQSWITIPCTFRNMDNEEGEDLIFKVPFLKNPVFDDHFDLEEPRQLVGKTIFWMSEHLPDSPAIHSCRALGLKLWNKPDRLVQLLKQYCETSDLQLHVDALDFIFDDQSNEKNDQTEKSVVDQELSKLVSKIKDSAHFTNNSLEASFFDQMNKELPELEKTDIVEQINLISSWNQRRIQLLENKVRQIYLKKRLTEIAELRKKLTEEREVVFFYENKATWEQNVHPDYKDADTSVSAGKLPSDEEYVVPELEKRTVDDRWKRF